jgi:glycosyltransferase involved in cell wall biosynthesis
VITDNRVIQDYVLNEYKKQSVLIEYGADQVSKQKITEDAILKHPFLSSSYAFNVCRIEPENNIHLLLEAFARHPFWNLVIVGLWNHGKYGKLLKEKYSNYPNLYLLDPIYDQDELNVLRSNTDLYVHGHSAGGTNPSLVEAMYLGLPIMAYDISYNRETTSHKALYFRNPDELIHLLNASGKSKLEEVGKAMYESACVRYVWKNIAQKL